MTTQLAFETDTSIVVQGGVTDLRRLATSSGDFGFKTGDVAEFQLRLRAHIPGLADNVRFLMERALGDDLIAVSYPGTIMRIVWRVNPNPVVVAAILVGVAVLVAFLTLFILFKISPEAAEDLAEFLADVAGSVAEAFSPLLLVGALLLFFFFFSQGGFKRKS